MTIKDLYEYCKAQGCENAEIEIDYKYCCFDGNDKEALNIDDFEIVKYMDSFDGEKTWQEFSRLVLHYSK